MVVSQLAAILDSLNRERVKYVVVGGVAVLLHGIKRFTDDLDLVIGLDPANVNSAIDTLLKHGLLPRVPCDPHEFADPIARRKWIDDKGMVVFAWNHPTLHGFVVDVFVDHPFPFEEMLANSIEGTLGNVKTRIASLDHLLAMKRHANRAKDQEDVRRLEQIKQYGALD